MSHDTSVPAGPPVTVLCGFLGAGKTTLLNHLLRQAEGRRWAAVVNDVAAINIDAAVVKGVVGDRGVVELGNGCVCCSNRDDLGEAIAQLAAAGEYQHILVETSGVAEPRGIAALFLQKNIFGRSLADYARLSSLVTVIDVAQLLSEWEAQRARADEPSASAQAGTQRPVFELMVEQIECADLIMLNKCDLVGTDDLRRAEEIVSGLNERAERIQTERGQVPAEFLLDRVRFSPGETLKAARWIKVLDDAGTGRPRTEGAFLARPGAAPLMPKPPRHEERYGIRSFVFQARKPFVQARFEALMARGFPGLLRAKGFFWLDERPDELGFVSVAGQTVRYDFPSYWWAALIESGKARRKDLPPSLEKVWIEPQGDRRQELVFIGVGLEEKAVREALVGCLVEETSSA